MRSADGASWGSFHSGFILRLAKVHIEGYVEYSRPKRVNINGEGITPRPTAVPTDESIATTKNGHCICSPYHTTKLGRYNPSLGAGKNESTFWAPGRENKDVRGLERPVMVIDYSVVISQHQNKRLLLRLSHKGHRSGSVGRQVWKEAKRSPLERTHLKYRCLEGLFWNRWLQM